MTMARVFITMIRVLCTPHHRLPALHTQRPIPGGPWIISTWDTTPGDHGPTLITARISIRTTIRFFTHPGTGIHITGTVDIMPGGIPTGTTVTGVIAVLRMAATMGVTGFPVTFRHRQLIPGKINGAFS